MYLQRQQNRYWSESTIHMYSIICFRHTTIKSYYCLLEKERKLLRPTNWKVDRNWIRQKCNNQFNQVKQRTKKEIRTRR